MPIRSDEVLAVPPGRATAAVLHEALAAPNEILCLATRGHGAVGNLLLGSVAEGVLARHSEPVLMVGPAFRAEEPVLFSTRCCPACSPTNCSRSRAC